MNWTITGDTHGRNHERILCLLDNLQHPQDNAIIILGDAGFNFYLNKTDIKNKQGANAIGCEIYCVRGNHEERPENISTMVSIYDTNVDGYVYYEPEFPHIHYFIDGGEYIINGLRTLVIGGAYSVDKWYRLSKAPAGAKWTGWFKDEQLTEKEMNKISSLVAGKHYDLVLSHTCPFDWMPTDLFIGCVNQADVDNTMELWINELKDSFIWDVWLFGHFHDDRLIGPHVEMFYKNFENLNSIMERWKNNEVKWWMKKDPRFYMRGV